MHILPHELKALVLYQIGALDGMARASGLQVSHVKPHGALNNMACEDKNIAAIITEAVRSYDRTIIILAPALSELAKAGIAAEQPVALEVFADRAYSDTGHLLPRNHAGAVFENPKECVANVTRMIEQGGIVSTNGTLLPTQFHSICVHGDSVLAAESATQVRKRLEELGYTVASLPEMRAQLL